jgi:PilZ domain-containing protein
MMERRLHTRYALSLPVTLTRGVAAPSARPAEMINLSAGGCYFQGALEGGVARATLSFKGQGAAFASGRIVRKTGDKGFAVEFDSTDAEVSRLASCLDVLSLRARNDFIAGLLKPEVVLT